MHHKRKRHPNARAGCAMCKPQKKGNGMNPDTEMGHTGFGKIRDLIHSDAYLKRMRNDYGT